LKTTEKELAFDTEHNKQGEWASEEAEEKDDLSRHTNELQQTSLRASDRIT
jgi:hypothetical protein